MASRKFSPIDIAAVALGVAFFAGIVFTAMFGHRMFAPVPTAYEIDAYDSHLKAASRAHVAGDDAAAIEHFTAAIEVNPNGFEAYLTRGVVQQQRGKWDAALDDYQTARELNHDDYAAWNNLGMLFAACPDDSICNGAKAVEYAQKACERTEWKHPVALNTLAIAYAELGDWQAATDICDQELDKAGDGALANDFRLLLELFKQEKPYRLPTPDE